MKKVVVTALSVLGLSLAAAPASADLIFTLDSGSTLGSGNYGTVTVHQVATDEVSVTVDLASGVGFANTGLQPFTFSLDSGIPALSASNFSNLTTGFAFNTTTPISNDGAGSFQYGLTCTMAVCGNGGNAPFVGPLTFDLTATGLLETSFITNGTATFAVDICKSIASDGSCTAGANTGVVYGNTSTTSGGGGGASSGATVPEPATLALLGLGLTIIALGRRTSAKR